MHISAMYNVMQVNLTQPLVEAKLGLLKWGFYTFLYNTQDSLNLYYVLTYTLDDDVSTQNIHPMNCSSTCSYNITKDSASNISVMGINDVGSGERKLCNISEFDVYTCYRYNKHNSASAQNIIQKHRSDYRNGSAKTHRNWVQGWQCAGKTGNTKTTQAIPSLHLVCTRQSFCRLCYKITIGTVLCCKK